MALAARDVDRDPLLAAYLRARARSGEEDRRDGEPSPGHAIRTCPSCGERAIFTLDPEGTWYACSLCGEFA
ncbi:MAG: hypothetical protein M3245_05225 [Actinomycetota bacterium]|nr:hypothetical protein [Actinomycetota bacterium]